MILILYFLFFFVSISDARMAGGCRSAWQECALVVSLEMFNILLERCNAMIKEQLETGSHTNNNPVGGSTNLASSRLLGEDLQIILPAVKVRDCNNLLEFDSSILVVDYLRLDLCFVLLISHCPVQVWCDWLLCHSTVWNPPPTSRDYHVGYDHLSQIF